MASPDAHSSWDCEESQDVRRTSDPQGQGEGCGKTAEDSKELSDFKQYVRSSSEFRDWPGYEAKPVRKHQANGCRRCATPLLISECGRLVLNHDKENGIYRATPFNMPEVEIGFVELVGTVLNTETYEQFFQLEVYDGTGIMTVIYSSEQYEKREERRKEIDRKYKITAEVRAMASRMMEILGKDCRSVAKDEIRLAKAFSSIYEEWWLASEKGLIGKHLEVGDYVNAFGFCLPTREINNTDPSYDIGIRPPNFFIAEHLDAIAEETYEKKFHEFVYGGLYKYRAKSTGNVVGSHEDPNKNSKENQGTADDTEIQDLLDDLDDN